ncbi:hypothetical protein GCM10011583_29040 [Streptomyces camponoticapitis]|uniref:Uncharacterized protein n=1 Tax=Streptomyces camponoticapitis TaxID=1616125 RepID=A0ABQ2E836_9ACTN|nr:hypothetical protein GCM10011583_29040 [Streptomyces camponoticapitis]
MAGSSHGHTPAAWTGVTISVIGFGIAGVFMVAADPIGFVGGLAVVLLGGIVGLAMRAAGLGAVKESEAAKQARVEAARASLDREEREAVERGEGHPTGQPQVAQTGPEPAKQTA